MIRLGVLCLGVLASSCGGIPESAEPRPQERYAVPPAYLAAVTDALNPEPHEVVRDLVAVTPENPELSWRLREGRREVKVVSVMADTVPFAAREGGILTTGTPELWVTAAPELQLKCAAPGFLGDDPRMRIRQLLGLTPTEPVEGVAVLWVSPEDLFRPAPDPEIDDSTAGLVLPADVPAWHRRWFNELRARQYVRSRDPPRDPYPWTQLGYTYDWAPGSDERGLSEFVIRTGAPVVVESVVPLTDYCTRESGDG